MVCHRCDQLILGKGANPEMIAKWFATAAPLPSTAGFAIGRSVFWEPGQAYLTGRMQAADAIEAMTSAYLSLIEEWHAATQKVRGFVGS